MCLAILKTPGNNVPTSYLQAGYESNPHGAGFAVARDGEVKIFKGYFSFDTFINAYEAEVRKEDAAVIHFRFATHGYINKDNCHPFKINSHYVMIHNGVIPGFGTARKSDTRQFAEIFLRPLMSKMDLDNVEFFKERGEPLEGFNLAFMFTVYKASQHNKIILLGKKGDFLICGENGGQWVGGNWYSNGCAFYHRPLRFTSGSSRGGLLLDSDKDVNTDEFTAEDAQAEMDAEQAEREALENEGGAVLDGPDLEDEIEASKLTSKIKKAKEGLPAHKGG